MSADTDLDLVFRNAAGKKVTLNIEEPKTGVTERGGQKGDPQHRGTQDRRNESGD